QVARQLLNKGLMVQDPEFGGLSLTPRAWDVFKGREIVLGRLDDKEEPEKPPEGAAQGQPAPFDRELFETLRKTRKELADASNVPPYVVFSDRTLVEMATYLPRDPEAMLHIHGVGRVKLDRYGSVFLERIEEYYRNHPTSKGPPSEESIS
ncbi:MAG: DNA helicase RecQ, partial [Syntrophobacteraceae bacterium]|nr:DNA helicase RecQ [Syntrophobacteraceae bacterium]